MQSGTQSKFILTLNPKRLAIIFSLLILFFTHAHVAGQFAHFFFGVDDSKLIDAFNLDYERNIPTLFVVAEWLFCLALLGFIAYYKKKEQMPYAHWLGMVILFFFLTLIGIVAWVTKGLILGELNIKRTPLDIPILATLVVFIISTILSISNKDSLIGGYGSSAKSLVAIIVFILFYYYYEFIFSL